MKSARFNEIVKNYEATVVGSLLSYGGHSELYRAANLVISELREEYPGVSFSSEINGQTSTIHVQVGQSKAALGEIQLKKQVKNRSWRGIDYGVKAILSDPWFDDESTSDAIVNRVKECEAKRAANREAMLNQAADLYIKIMDSTGKSEYAVDDFIRFMDGNRWTIHDIVKKRKEAKN